MENKCLKNTQTINILSRKQINDLPQGYIPNISTTENMIEYFNVHYRDNDYDKSMKVKLIQTQGNIAQNCDIQNTREIQSNNKNKDYIEDIAHQTKALQAAKYKLKNILSEAGYKNININFKYGCSSPAINFNVYQSNKDKYEDKIKERLDSL